MQLIIDRLDIPIFAFVVFYFQWSLIFLNQDQPDAVVGMDSKPWGSNISLQAPTTMHINLRHWHHPDCSLKRCFQEGNDMWVLIFWWWERLYLLFMCVRCLTIIYLFCGNLTLYFSWVILIVWSLALICFSSTGCCRRVSLQGKQDGCPRKYGNHQLQLIGVLPNSTPAWSSSSVVPFSQKKSGTKNSEQCDCFGGAYTLICVPEEFHHIGRPWHFIPQMCRI